ncbi:cyclic AMP-dependent transcription factor ATF-1-like isoform X3 [Planococcus citri]|uniref:cyclic AMP-dependent transcription factor ATF-1-like isoform X3 n=1 Tax=Planococcus citri TaxID=170843 RepID=UPI0031F74B8D
MTMIMDVIKEENNNNAASDTSMYSTANTTNSIPLTSMSSVIHANQQSVIQTASPTIQTPVLSKGNVILVSNKLGSVIQAPHGNLQPLHLVDSKSDMDESISPDEESVKKRREKLIRRPSYRKILNDIARAELGCAKMESSGSDCDSNVDNDVPVSSVPDSGHYQSVLPSGHLQLSSQCGNVQGLPTIMSNSNSGSLIQYSNQEGQYFMPNDIVVTQNSGNVSINSVITEDQVRKRELRLLKNREAARECRRKKKEYIKCLENRVAVLENQNKALIEELKSLKELYCQQKPE